MPCWQLSLGSDRHGVVAAIDEALERSVPVTGSGADGSRWSCPRSTSARYLAETIESILAQTRPADEVVVVDDESTDDSVAIAQRYAPAVRVLRVDHAGGSASRQRGYEATTGELLANCDADDLWLPTKLERQCAVLDDQPDLHAVGCQVDEFLSPDADSSMSPGRGIRLGHRSYAASALLVRRSFVELLGGFWTDRVVGESVEWHARALSAGLRAAVVDEVLVRRRLHQHNTSRIFARESDEYLFIIRDHLERERRA